MSLFTTMIFQPNHTGLYFTPHAVAEANSARDREPFKSAWALLLEEESTPETLAGVLRDALRYRIAGDVESGARGIANLLHLTEQPVHDHVHYLEHAATLAALTQCFELLRDHPAFDQRGAWLAWLEQAITSLNQPAGELAHHEQLWLAVVNMTGGIALEREALFNDAVAVYQQTIDRHVHPEGYIKPAVEDHKDRDGLFRLLWSVKALTLLAEAANASTGLDLWHYEFRGVGLLTAALYPLAYYFRPEKWPWLRSPDPNAPVEPLTVEEAEPLFKQHGAFYEIVNRHAEKQKAITLFLDAQRPLFDPYGGGLTTLTHGIAKKRRGLFG